jgi:Mg2+ and Co2+ transporter CorA
MNIQMAAESTLIARSSHQDNQSLRIIQIMSMIFLPASLVASIFGMGFFSTDADSSGTAVFQVAKNWWLYIVVAVPLTAIIMGIMLFYGKRDTQRAIEQTRKWSDAEIGLKNE